MTRMPSTYCAAAQVQAGWSLMQGERAGGQVGQRLQSPLPGCDTVAAELSRHVWCTPTLLADQVF